MLFELTKTQARFNFVDPAAVDRPAENWLG